MSGNSEETTTDPERVTCQVCRRELPVSEALVSEARDYILYFCGADCLVQFEKEARHDFGRSDDDERLS